MARPKKNTKHMTSNEVDSFVDNVNNESVGIDSNTKEKIAFIEDTIRDEIKASLLLDTTSAIETSHSNIDDKRDYGAYDTKKLILMKTLEEINLKDMTNLDEDEIEDIENALMLNIIVDNPLIDNVCTNHLRLKRSWTDTPKSLLHHLFEWSSGEISGTLLNPIQRILGKKGSN